MSITAAGAALAQRLPYEHRHGDLGDTVRELWDGVDRLVLVATTGIAVRVIAPLLSDKHHDPAVVCLDDGGRWAVALAGGHHGANDLAREVASLVGAEPVVTTATDAAGLPALDDLPGFRTTGDVAAVTRAWLDGVPPTVDRTDLPRWPLPPALAALANPPTEGPDQPAILDRGRSHTDVPDGDRAAATHDADGRRSSYPAVPTHPPAGAAPAPSLPPAPTSSRTPATRDRAWPPPADTFEGVSRPPSTDPDRVPGGPDALGDAVETGPAGRGTPLRAEPPTRTAELGGRTREPIGGTATGRPGTPAAGTVPSTRAGNVGPGTVGGVGEAVPSTRAGDIGPGTVGGVGEAVPSTRAGNVGPGAVGDSGEARPAPVVRVTDRAGGAAVGEVLLRPGSLVVGVGSSSRAAPGGIAELVAGALATAGLSPDAVGLVASVDLKREEPAIVALAGDLGVELRTFPSASLAMVDVPTPSPVVEAAVGTPSVAEAAALLAAGPGAELVVAKQRSAEATVAVARRARPEGHLAVVGLGPGDPAWRTPAAAAAVRRADVVVGYGLYVDLATDLLGPRHEVVRSPIGAETDRCRTALERATAGQRVALVCSGDPGVFAMASLVCELAPAHGNPPIDVVPGVTAAYGAAAVLGAPLGHDHAMVSLSDLLTPWPLIERRLVAVAEGDLAVALYNPRSLRRTWQLGRAVEILAAHRPASCPVAVVSDVGRAGRERTIRTTLADFDPAVVDMLSLVIVGSSTTRWQAGTMVTPRGYPPSTTADTTDTTHTAIVHETATPATDAPHGRPTVATTGATGLPPRPTGHHAAVPPASHEGRAAGTDHSPVARSPEPDNDNDNTATPS